MKYLLLLLIAVISVESRSQTEDSLFSHSFSFRINMLGLPFDNYTIFIDKKLSKRNYVEISAGYKLPHMSNGNKFLFFSEKDPSWYYTRFKAGISFNHYFTNNFYIAPLLQYRYSKFEDAFFENYINHEGDAYDEDWWISREKDDFGVLIKFCYVYVPIKHFIFDIYTGIGIKKEYSTEYVLSRKDYWGNEIDDIYPIISNKKGYYASILFGISVGFCL